MTNPIQAFRRWRFERLRRRREALRFSFVVPGQAVSVLDLCGELARTLAPALGWDEEALKLRLVFAMVGDFDDEGGRAA